MVKIQEFLDTLNDYDNEIKDKYKDYKFEGLENFVEEMLGEDEKHS